MRAVAPILVFLLVAGAALLVGFDAVGDGVEGDHLDEGIERIGEQGQGVGRQGVGVDCVWRWFWSAGHTRGFRFSKKQQGHGRQEEDQGGHGDEGQGLEFLHGLQFRDFVGEWVGDAFWGSDFHWFDGLYGYG